MAALVGLRFDIKQTLKNRNRRKAHDDRLREEAERAERAAKGIPEPEQYS